MRTALTAAGSPVTPHQIERWRREGLLPRPRQIGHGRGKGSSTIVPQASVAQAQEIVRLYAQREKRDWVGWQLWLRGFVVAERYWQAPLESARNAILETRRAAQRYESSSQEENNNLDALKDMVLTAVRKTPLHAPLTGIPPTIVETLCGFLREIVIGEFEAFSHETDSEPNRDEREAVLAVIGANTPGNRRIADFGGTIENVLQDIAKAFSAITRRNSMITPAPAARREFLAVMEIGISLYWNSKALIGHKALAAFHRIATNGAISTQALMLLCWAEYRDISTSKLPFSEIDEIHDLAVKLTAEIRN